MGPSESSKQTPAGRDETARTEGRRSSVAALRHRDFRLMWGGQIVSVTGSQMQFVAINWHVYVLTKSSVALGMVGLSRVLPIIVCSLVGGVVADAVDRKRLMLATQGVMLLSAAALAAVTAAGLEQVWPIYALTAAGAAAQAFDNPARQAMLPALVPVRDFPNAVSLGFLAFQFATVTGPVLAGLMLANYGPEWVYTANAASFLAVVVALLLIRTSGRAAPDEGGEAARGLSFEALKEGLRFVWRTPVIVQTMTLDFVATFFASATALLPIFAAEILRVGERGYGILSAAQAAGAVLAGLWMARRGEWARPGAWVVGSVAVYGAATLLFGVSRVFWFSFLMLAVSGAADTVSTVIRQTIRQLITPDRLRGRMTSVNMIFFMGGPQLGEFEAGLLARAVGAPLSVVLGGVGCLVAVAVALLKAEELLRYRIPKGEEARA
ncbi:MAG TPA: MFS transporter [Pyrinomonadaceae bacterium]|nr:MFS transporter [Pyrinomonadaceae bacterium]